MKQVICDVFPSSDGKIVLQGDAHRHLAMSLRKKVGEHINVRLPSGKLVECEIVEISKSRIVCYCLSTVDETSPLSVIFVLLQWELKGEKMDAVIRCATELGVNYILPVIGNYSVPRVKSQKEKMRRESIIRSAREQSGSPICTTLSESLSLPQVLKNLDEMFKMKNVRKLLAYERQEAESESVFSSIEGDEEVVAVAIGAEGGISACECSLLREQGFKMLYFQGNILRAETASVYALSSLREVYIGKSNGYKSRLSGDSHIFR